MISMRLCLIALAIVFVSIQIVSSLKCYTCDPKSSQGCNATKQANQTCTGDDDRCLSIQFKNNTPAVLRCYNSKSPNLCDGDAFTKCKICDKDNCNSSSFVSPSILTITIFAAILSKMYF